MALDAVPHHLPGLLERAGRLPRPRSVDVLLADGHIEGEQQFELPRLVTLNLAEPPGNTKYSPPSTAVLSADLAQ